MSSLVTRCRQPKTKSKMERKSKRKEGKKKDKVKKNSHSVGTNIKSPN